MIFDQTNAPHLKSWLVRTLEPICDAEPGALADYILALLQHNVAENEMRKELAAQLDEFLEKECSAFIDTLFTALRSKSYLPYTTSPPPPPSKTLDSGIPIPLDGLVSTPEGSRKRALDQDDHEGGPPPKGPRLDSDEHFSRYGNSGHDGRWENNRGRSQGNGYRDSRNESRTGYHPPDQRRICRDYHNQGYCSRGALCKYSHGEDALIPSQFYMNNPMMQGGMPFMPMLANGFGMMGGGPVTAYDPHEAKMDMRTMGNNRQARPAVLPRMQSEEGGRVVHGPHMSGELPVIQDLTPEVAHHEVTPNPQHHSSHSSIPSESRPQPGQQADHPMDFIHPDYPDRTSQPHIPDVSMLPPERHRPASNGFRGGGPRGRGGGPGSFRPERRKDKTLVLEKIPEDKMSLEHVNGWFKRFGTVTNVAIDQANNKALISFSTHEEAFAAWKSEDAVFNNRFVKVFWHRPMEGQGQVGQRMLAASAPVVANSRSKETHQGPKAASGPQASTPSSTSASSLAIKQQKLEQLISEQKTLMGSLEGAQAEERKSIMARLRKLDEEMKAVTSAPQPSTSTDSKEDKEKERLDKELELHSVVNGSEEDGKETTEDLKAKLERLKAEAASLGIPDSSSEGHHSGTYRPYRGRGRGFTRGAFRGGPPRASMRLDNRPKGLLIKGVGTEGLQAIRDWYETTGQMESVTTTDNGDIVVSFKSRHAAEQGLAKGTSIPVLGTLQITWHSGTVPAAPQKMTTEGSNPDTKSETGPREASPARSTHHEEEVVANGWGGDDDGMGMI